MKEKCHYGDRVGFLNTNGGGLVLRWEYDQGGAPGFGEVAEILEEVHSVTGTAESHGILCGLMCVPANFEFNAWVAHISEADTQEESGLTGEQEERLKGLMRETLNQLDSPDMTVRLLLPDNSEKLQARVVALADWCRGFLFGIGISGCGSLEKIDKDSQEFIEDIKNISQVDEAGVDGTEMEEDEKAYFELVEFVRVGLLMFREDLMTNNPVNPPSGAIH
jgi:hypothetical protein